MKINYTPVVGAQDTWSAWQVLSSLPLPALGHTATPGGSGVPQTRVRVSGPVPHVTEHWLHGPQVCQLPSKIIVNVCQLVHATVNLIVQSPLFLSVYACPYIWLYQNITSNIDSFNNITTLTSKYIHLLYAYPLTDKKAADLLLITLSRLVNRLGHMRMRCRPSMCRLVHRDPSHPFHYEEGSQYWSQ